MIYSAFRFFFRSPSRHIFAHNHTTTPHFSWQCAGFEHWWQRGVRYYIIDVSRDDQGHNKTGDNRYIIDDLTLLFTRQGQSAYILKLCAVVFTMRHKLVSAHIAPCAVVFTIRRISVSAHIKLCAVVFTMRHKLVSAHIALCAVVFTMRHISVSAHIALCAVVFTIRHIGISPYRTLCSGFNYETYIGISQYHTLCSGFSLWLWDVYRYQPISHSVQWFSLWDIYRYQAISHPVQWFSPWDVYRYQRISHFVLWFSLWDIFWCQPISHSVQWFSPWDIYRYQPISHSVQWFHYEIYIAISRYSACSLNCNACMAAEMHNTYYYAFLIAAISYVNWSCEKIQTLFIIRAILKIQYSFNE